MRDVSAGLFACPDAGTERRAAALLEADAIGVRSASASFDVAVLLAAGRSAHRLRTLRGIAVTVAPRPIVVAMPADAGNAVLRKALIAGASGVVLDDVLPEALAATVRAVAAGQLALPPAMRSQVAPRPLSHREREIVGLVASGCTNRQIAARLFLAESTVKSHLASAFDKLDVGSRAEVTALVLRPDGPVALRAAEDRLATAR